MKKLISINKWVLVFIIVIPLLILLLVYMLLQMKVEKTYEGELISNKDSKPEFILRTKNPSQFEIGKAINFFIDNKFYKSYITYAERKADSKVHLTLNNVGFNFIKNQVIPAKIIYSSQSLWSSILNNSL